jgi:hypothetical protein
MVAIRSDRPKAAALALLEEQFFGSHFNDHGGDWADGLDRLQPALAYGAPPSPAFPQGEVVARCLGESSGEILQPAPFWGEG